MGMRWKARARALLVLLATGVMAESAVATTRRLADVDSSTRDSGPQSFLTAGGVTFFTALHPAIGVELWRTDGTDVTLVADLHPGPAGSDPVPLLAVGDTLWFRACEPAAGCELWRTDGVTTQRVTDIAPGPADSSPDSLAVLGSHVYFKACEPTRGCELWRTDGATTSRITDIVPGSGDATPSHLFAFGGRLLFAATDVIRGRQLYRTDGLTTVRMTNEIVDVNPSEFVAFGNRAVFRACDFEGCEPWWTDGVTASRLADINPGGDSSYPIGLTVFGNAVFFSARSSNGAGSQLWKFDGTTITQVTTVRGDAQPRELTVLGDRLLFRACEPFTGCELWTSDGTTATMLADLRPGSGGSSPSDLTVLDDRVYFHACAGPTSCPLWRTDGTSVTRVAGIEDGPKWGDPFGFARVGNRLVFSSCDPDHGCEPWATDGTTAWLLADLHPYTNDGVLRPFTQVGAAVFFSGCDADAGCELWRTDGRNTARVADIAPGPEGSDIDEITALGPLAIFSACDAESGCEPWRSDGVTTSRIASLSPFEVGSHPAWLTRMGAHVYFSSGGLTGYQVRRTDGVTVTQVGNLGQYPYPFPSELTVHGDTLYFRAQTSLGDELWRSDGTTTAMVVDLVPGSGSSYPRQLSPVGDLLYFRACPAGDCQLWQTNGTSTVRVSTVWPGPVPSMPEPLFADADRLLVWGGDVQGERALWIVDARGPRVLLPHADPSYTTESWAARVGDVTVFAACDDESGCEPWWTDGTSATRLADIMPGPADSAPVGFTVLGDRVYFRACDDSGGCELWQTDGLTTVRVADIEPGPASSTPTNLLAVEGSLFFQACDAVAGCEPWIHLASCGDGALDPGETCDAGAANGQPDSCCTADCEVQPAGTTCRPAIGACDTAEVCDGSAATCPADAGPLDPDACVEASLCYATVPSAASPRFAAEAIFLDDGSGPHAAIVRAPKALCLPAAGDTAHTAFTVAASAPRATGVGMRDRFGMRHYDLRGADRLLVPTAVALDAAPGSVPTVDHYRCHKVRVSRGTTPFPRDVQITVADALQTRRYAVQQPRRLCIPVGVGGAPRVTPGVHLACYQVRPAHGEPRHTPVVGRLRTASPLGPGAFDTRREEELCVPAVPHP